MAGVEVVISDDARTFAAPRGGVVYVRSHAHRCCAGPLTLLNTTTEVPADAGDFVRVGHDDGDSHGDGLTVRYLGSVEAGPHVLTVERRGRLRRRLVSYWDGCAFKV